MNALEEMIATNEALKKSPVPCNGCRSCCQGASIVMLLPGVDNPELYVGHVQKIEMNGKERYGLAFKANGDCYYLGKEGCKIYDKRPMICRSFDCRRAISDFPADKINRLIAEGVFAKPIVKAAKKRMTTLVREDWESKTPEQKKAHFDMTMAAQKSAKMEQTGKVVE